MLKFKGIQKTTLVDYPGEVACTLFLGGCNFRCAYCFNPDLVLEKDTGISISEEEFFRFLDSRKDFLDAVCITGGEPLLNNDLSGFLKKIKEKDFKVKIDTNGAFPDHLRKLIELQLVDFIAMDIKAPLDKYNKISGVSVDLASIEQSVKLIKESKIDYEFRTTVYSELDLSDFEKIGKWLKGSKKYCLQLGKFNIPHLDKSLTIDNEVSEEKINEISDSIKHFFDKVEIRGSA